MVSFLFWLWLSVLEPVRPRLLASYSVLYTTKVPLHLLYLGAVCVCDGVVWFGLEVYFYFFFRLKSSNDFSMKLLFGRSFIFCNFVCNQGALNFRLQVLVSPVSVSDHGATSKISQKLNINGLDLRVFDSYKSSNVFFRFTF